MNEIKELEVLFAFSNYFLSSSFLSGGPFNVRFLKRLSIRSLREIEGFDLEDINRFKHLELLEIGIDKPTRENLHLFLPKLETLQIFIYLPPPDLEIDAPNLRELELPNRCTKEELGRPRSFKDPEERSLHKRRNDISSLRFKQPKSIKLLSLPDARAYSRYPNCVREFQEVECLHIKFCVLSGAGPHDIDPYFNTASLEVICEEFPKLHRLNLNQVRFCHFDLTKFRRLAEWASTKPRLKVYYTGIELSNDQRLFDDFAICHKASEKTTWSRYLGSDSYELALQLKNYPALADQIESIRYLQYDELADVILPLLDRNGLALTNLLPGDFFERYPTIYSIKMWARAENEEHFRQLVKGCRKLRRLCLTNSYLSQAFFDELPAISLLNSLRLEEANELQMHFLWRMNHLIEFVTNQQLSAELVLKLAKSRHSRELGCVIKKNPVEIHRKGRNEYLWKPGSVETINFKSLAEHLYNLEIFSSETMAS